MQGERRLAVAASIVAALAVAMAGFYPGNNPDTFGHLAQGRQIAELGHVPQVDTLSLLKGPPRPWHNYEWLSDLGTYLLYAHAGYASVTWFKCGLLVVTVLALARFAALLGGARAAVFTSLVVISTIPAIRLRLSDRPHVLGICFAALYLLLLAKLTRASARRARLGMVVLVGAMHLIWVNAHGSHLLGLAITGSFLVSVREAWPSLSLILLLQLAASCVSPYGPAIVLDAIAHVFDPRYRQIVTEWQPWRETDPVWIQLGPALQGAILALFAPKLVRASAVLRASVLVALLLGVACFRSVRFVAEFLLLSAPLVGVGCALLRDELSFPQLAVVSVSAAATLAAVVIFGIQHASIPLGFGAGISFAGLPRASTIILARDARAPRVLASMQDSWFTLFATPSARVVIDGRVPFYGIEHLSRTSAAFASEDAFVDLVQTFRLDTVIAGFAFSDDRTLARFAPKHGFSLRIIEDLHALYTRDDVLRSGSYPPLRALRPSYAMAWILDADAAQRGAMHGELARLAALPGTESYRAWVEVVLLLSSLRRGDGDDGFRWPRTDEDWTRYRAALPQLATASEDAGYVPSVAALHGYVAAVLCEFDVAEEAVDRALREGPAREPLLVMQELKLRTGHVDEVREVVTRARQMPEGRNDAWLDELAQGTKVVPACPR